MKATVIGKGPGAATITGATEIGHLVGGGSAQLHLAEPCVRFLYSAHLLALPAPLELKHGPLLVTMEHWTDGVVIARLPDALLEVAGPDECTALEDLGVLLLETFTRLSELKKTHHFAAPAQRQWRALTGLVIKGNTP